MDLTSFFEQLPLGSYRLKMDGTMLRINAAFAQLHGYQNQADFQRHVGLQLPQLYQDPKQWAQLHTALCSQGQVRNFVSRWTRHKTGETLWVRENAHLVCDGDQAPLYYEGTVEDISAEQCTVLALKDKESILHSLLQAIPDQVWLKDLYGTYLACNDSYAAALGLSPERIIGTVDADHPAAAMAAHYFVADETVIRMGKPIRYEVDIRAAGKTTYDTFEIVKAPLRGNSGAVLGVLGMARTLAASGLPSQQANEHLELALLGADLGRWECNLLAERGFCMDARAWQMLGYPELERNKVQQFGELLHPDDQAEALRALREHLEGTTPALVVEYRALHARGDWIWLSCRGKVVQTSRNGTPLRMAGTLMDVTERKWAEHELRATKAELQATLNALPDLLFELTPQGICRAVHCMDPQLLVLPAAELRDKNLCDFLPADASAVYLLALEEAGATGRSKGRQYSLALQGETRWFELSVVCKPSEPGDEPRLIAIARDITERKSMGDAMAHLAFHDTLTGLPNRRLLIERIQRAISSSSRTQQHGALIFLDLDHFKTVNDQYGHETGDLLLQETARRLQQSIREIDSVARLGGDEFVVLINDLSEDRIQAQAQASALGQKILHRISEPFLLKQCTYSTTSSIGATLFKGDTEDHNALLQQADTAMYQAKAAGRNTLRFFSSS
jgi:diguanylate cyclase (GGDEF)-like protein/PAS domain S-box-containing protein